MAKLGRPKKKQEITESIEPNEAENHVEPAEIEEPEPIQEPQPEQDEIECSLPKKDLFRIDEVARYFDVSEQTIRLWIDHHKLAAERYTRGALRITRVSIIDLRRSAMMVRR